MIIRITAMAFLAACTLLSTTLAHGTEVSLDSLLSLQDFHGQHKKQPDLVWLGNKVDFKPKAFFQPTAVSPASREGIRTVTAYFTRWNNQKKKQFVFMGPKKPNGQFHEFHSHDPVFLQMQPWVSLQIQIYFVGERFEDLTLHPDTATGRKGSRAITLPGGEEETHNTLSLGDIVLQFRYSKPGTTKGALLDTDQRLIKDPDPDRPALWAMLVCDGDCGDHRPTSKLALATNKSTPPKAVAPTGLNADEIRKLQEKLTALRYQPGKIDGVFGQSTRKALIQFQHDNSLAATGEPHQPALNLLQELYKKAAYTEIVFKKSDGTAIHDQNSLEEQYKSHPFMVCLTKKSLDVSLQGRSSDQLYSVQVRNYNDECLDQGATWKGRILIVSLPADPPETKDDSCTKDLPPEFTKEQVKDIQEKLVITGYDPGAKDGQWGAKTANALASFQGGNEIEATSCPNPETLIQLAHIASSTAQGIEILFQRNGHTITEPSELKRLVTSNSFTACLNDNDIQLTVYYDDQLGRDTVGAKNFLSECVKPWLTYEENIRLVTIDLDSLNDASIVTDQHKQPSPQQSDQLGDDGPLSRILTIKFRFPSTDADSNLEGTISVKAGDGKIVYGPQDITSNTASIPMSNLDDKGDLTVISQIDGYKTDSHTVEGFSPDTPSKTFERDLTPIDSVTDLYFVPTFQLFGDTVPADLLIQDRDCIYSLQIGEEEPIPLDPFSRDRRRMLRAQGINSAALESKPLRPMKIIAEPRPDNHRCFEVVHTELDTRTDTKGVISVPIQHPKPWFLGVFTSSGFPHKPGLRQDLRKDERIDFFEKVLKTVEEVRRTAATGAGHDWLFARLVEGSTQGGATLFLAGADSSTSALKTHSLFGLDEKAQDDLLLTPTQAGGFSGGGGGQLEETELRQPLLDFAKKNYHTIDGRFHTVLWVRGDRTFSSDHCKRFQRLADSLGAQRIRILEFVPVRSIPARYIAPDGAQYSAVADTLQPYSMDYGYEGVFVCNRSAFSGSGSELIVFEYGKSFGTSRKEKPLKALEDALHRFRSGQ